MYQIVRQLILVPFILVVSSTVIDVISKNVPILGVKSSPGSSNCEHAL